MTLFQPPILEGAVPTGAAFPYVGTTAPDGYLMLNGDTIGKTGSGAVHEGEELRDLFNLVKNVAPNTGLEDFDAGNTVQLPDARQRHILGKASAGTGSTLGGTGGAINHTHSVAGHVHSLGGHQHETPLFTGGGFDALTFGIGPLRPYALFLSPIPVPGNTNTLLTGAASGNTGAGSGNTSSNNAPYLALNIIVKI